MMDSLLDDPIMQGTVLRKANFRGATIRKGSWKNAVLEQAELSGASLDNVDLRDVSNVAKLDLNGANLFQSDLSGLNFENGSFNECKFTRTDLTNSNLAEARFISARFRECDLSGADLTGAMLSHTSWHGCTVSSQTVLTGSVWKLDHDPINDGADQLQKPWYRHILNWGFIRILARVPLFSGAYLLLTVALSIATAIAWVNETGFLTTLAYPVLLPPKLKLLLLGSTALALGTTIFEIACPTRIKEFSRTRWVEELKRPGLFYEVDLLRRPVSNLFSLIFSFLGACLLVYVFADRLRAALTVVITSA